MILKNVHFYNECFEKETADIKINDGKIEAIGVFDEDGENLNDYTVIPGLVDVHIHGANGGDFGDNSAESLNKISSFLLSHGITSFCPTTMTLNNTELKNILKTGKEYIGKESGAKVVGFHLEGPFISAKKCGAQDKRKIRYGTVEEFDELNKTSGGNIKIITIAPESFDSENFIKNVSKKAVVSIGHSSANAKEAKEAIEFGINHATHLFNAMTGMTHREPGIVGTAFDSENVFCEIICDGAHISPVVIRNSFKILGEHRAVVISDSMKAAGMPSGKYDLGGQDVFTKDGVKYALMEDGTIAASITNLFDEFKNLLDFGIDFKTALKSCTINPAKSINLDNTIGSIATGKDADLVVLDKNNSIKWVYLKGEKRG